jgi:hypothetical protein
VWIIRIRKMKLILKIKKKILLKWIRNSQTPFWCFRWPIKILERVTTKTLSKSHHPITTRWASRRTTSRSLHLWIRSSCLRPNLLSCRLQIMIILQVWTKPTKMAAWNNKWSKADKAWIRTTSAATLIQSTLGLLTRWGNSSLITKSK